jgi:hypothetical protein
MGVDGWMINREMESIWNKSPGACSAVAVCTTRYCEVSKETSVRVQRVRARNLKQHLAITFRLAGTSVWKSMFIYNRINCTYLKVLLINYHWKDVNTPKLNIHLKLVEVIRGWTERRWLLVLKLFHAVYCVFREQGPILHPEVHFSLVTLLPKEKGA